MDRTVSIWNDELIKSVMLWGGFPSSLRSKRLFLGPLAQEVGHFFPHSFTSRVLYIYYFRTSSISFFPPPHHVKSRRKRSSQRTKLATLPHHRHRVRCDLSFRCPSDHVKGGTPTKMGGDPTSINGEAHWLGGADGEKLYLILNALFNSI